MIAAKGGVMDAGVMIPLGVFAMLVAGWYIQTRAGIAEMEALSRDPAAQRRTMPQVRMICC